MSGGIRVNAAELRYQRQKRVLTCRELAQEAGVAYSTLLTSRAASLSTPDLKPYAGWPLF